MMFIEGDVDLSTQAEVDSFVGSSIAGNLLIHGSDIVDLKPLSVLDSVDGYLRVGINGLNGGNASLTNLDGLSNITSVGGLTIWTNDVLTSLDGLSNITSFGGHLHVAFNASLTNLDGLSNLISVGGRLVIKHNASLNNFCGLYSLLSSNGLQGSFDVSSNLINPTQQQIIDDGPCMPAA